MFITNGLTPNETLAELLLKSRSTISDTEWFKTKTHNADLCPMLEMIGMTILQSYKAYRASCLDIQGMRDNGVDVYLKYDTEDGATKIGIQVKSYTEIADWAAKKDKTFIKTLKSQYAEAKENLGLEHYFLIICTDAHEHREQIRTIASELKQFSNLTIVKPEQVLALMRMSSWELQAAVSRLLCEDDPVLNAARKNFDDEPSLADYMTLYLLCRVYGGGNRAIAYGDFEDIVRAWSDLRGEEFDMQNAADALSDMIGGGYLRSIGESYQIVPEEFPDALCAIYFDLRARNGLDSDDSLEYLVPLLLN